MAIHTHTLKQQIQTGTHDLLNTITVGTHRGGYVGNEAVNILINPYPAEQEGYYNILMTISPLLGPAAWLADTTIILQGAEQRDGSPALTTRFGRLNRRGQIIFRNLTAGIYQPMAVLREGAQPDTPPAQEQPAWNVLYLPRQHLRKVAAARSKSDHTASSDDLFRSIFQSDSGVLTATVQELETGEFLLELTVRDAAWHDTLLAIECVTVPADNAGMTEAQRFFAVLTWNKRDQVCGAEINLGRLAYAFELRLSEQPVALALLAQAPGEVIQQSIARAATHYTRKAWARLLKGETLPPQIARIVEHALET